MASLHVPLVKKTTSATVDLYIDVSPAFRAQGRGSLAKLLGAAFFLRYLYAFVNTVNWRLIHSNNTKNCILEHENAHRSYFTTYHSHHVTTCSRANLSPLCIICVISVHQSLNANYRIAHDSSPYLLTWRRSSIHDSSLNNS